jgi:mannose-6-phosphate isomerase-like protein (cupin superfamily)
MGKYEKYVITPFEEKKDLPWHDRSGVEDIGPLIAFLNKNIVAEADLNIYVHHMKIEEGNAPDYVEMHTHDVSQAYVFPTEGLTFEVTLGDEKYTVESPAYIFIPPGLVHNLKMLKGEGLEVCILRKEEYK